MERATGQKPLESLLSSAARNQSFYIIIHVEYGLCFLANKVYNKHDTTIRSVYTTHSTRKSPALELDKKDLTNNEE